MSRFAFSSIRQNFHTLLKKRQERQEHATVLRCKIEHDEALQAADFEVRKTCQENPNFHELAPVIAYGPTALGSGSVCPRDGRPGCALVATCLHKRLELVACYGVAGTLLCPCRGCGAVRASDAFSVLGLVLSPANGRAGAAALV